MKLAPTISCLDCKNHLAGLWFCIASFEFLLHAAAWMTGLKADLAVIVFNDSKLLNVPFKALHDCLLPTSPVHLLHACPFFQMQQQGRAYGYHCPNPEGPSLDLSCVYSCSSSKTRLTCHFSHDTLSRPLTPSPGPGGWLPKHHAPAPLRAVLEFPASHWDCQSSSGFESKNSVLVNERSLSSWDGIWHTEGQWWICVELCWECVLEYFSIGEISRT